MLDVSKERIRQIQDAALEKLRKLAQEERSAAKPPADRRPLSVNLPELLIPAAPSLSSETTRPSCLRECSSLVESSLAECPGRDGRNVMPRGAMDVLITDTPEMLVGAMSSIGDPTTLSG